MIILIIIIDIPKHIQYLKILGKIKDFGTTALMI
jgi:hypothetical protein